MTRPEFIRPVPSATFRSIDRGGVLLDVKTGSYFELNETGCFLWQEISHGAEFDSLKDALARRYAISEDEAASDVEAFLSELFERSLLIGSDSTPPDS